MPQQDRANRPQWDSQSIQELRRHLGLTQRELADRLGTRQQTISEWETGMYKPRGTAATLLSIIAERTKFEYRAILAYVYVVNLTVSTFPDAAFHIPFKRQVYLVFFQFCLQQINDYKFIHDKWLK